jgi:pimeloyl-ACP methyl ester carboxylesterase
MNVYDNYVNGVRDLIDFFPVYVNIKNVLSVFDPGSYTYKLKSEDGSLRFMLTDLKPETAGDYLTGSETSLEPATTLGGAETYKITKDGVTLKDLSTGSEFLRKIKDEGKGIILLEGRKASDKPLVLAVYNNQTSVEVFSTSLKLSLDGVEQMFRHKNLIKDSVITDGTTDENNDDTVPDPEHGSKLGGEPDRLGDPANLPDSESNQQNFVFIHGYSVNGQQARGWHSEMFKRMYWSGSRAKFWGVSWYGFRTQLLDWITPDYHINVRHAFNSAKAFKDFLSSTLCENITVTAHSLGNMVVSSAINDWSANVKNYFMLNAAVPTESFYWQESTADGQDSTNQAMLPSKWSGYRKDLRSTEWYNLFPVDPATNSVDYRSKLTWRVRFADGSLGAFNNLFSSGEDVLTDEWIWQEQLKGTVGVLGYNGADYGGWGFNLTDSEYYVETDELDPVGKKVREPISYDDANKILDSALIAKPFFKRGGLIESLLTAGASDFALTNKNRLLSESFPALTSAVGTNEVRSITVGNNIDMQDADSGFQTKKNGITKWPRESGLWLHSDVKDVAYVYTYGIYIDLVDRGGLK